MQDGDLCMRLHTFWVYHIFIGVKNVSSKNFAEKSAHCVSDTVFLLALQFSRWLNEYHRIVTLCYISRLVHSHHMQTLSDSSLVGNNWTKLPPTRIYISAHLAICIEMQPSWRSHCFSKAFFLWGNETKGSNYTRVVMLCIYLLFVISKLAVCSAYGHFEV
jgi:hypothetical protein